MLKLLIYSASPRHRIIRGELDEKASFHVLKELHHPPVLQYFSMSCRCNTRCMCLGLVSIGFRV